jgi:PAS domain S-box-containing protein
MPAMRAIAHAAECARADLLFVSCDGEELEEIASYRRRASEARCERLARSVWARGRAASARCEDGTTASGLPIHVGDVVAAVIVLYGARDADDDLLETLDAVGAQIGATLTRLPIERAMRAELDRTRAVLDAAEPIAIVAPDGTITEWNPAAERTFGHRAASVVGRAAMELAPERWRSWWRRRARDTPARTTAPVSCADGTERLAELVFSEVDGDHTLLSLRDVTDERRRARALRRATGAAERAARERDRFIATLAHEIRNPLAPIRAVADMTDASEWQAARAILERNVQHLSRLLDDVLDVSRAAHGKFALDRRAVSVEQLVRAAIEMSEGDIRARHQRLQVDVEPGLLAAGDRGRLVQVVSNLVTNASRYTPRGGNVAIEARAIGEEVVLSVRDDGAGMGPELLSRAFEPFAQGPNSGGLGLGLALVRSIVELHGGSVAAHSAGAGLGTEVVVRLARAIEPPEEVTVDPPRESPGMRVLIVDDNEDAAELLSLLLRRHGHDVRTAGSAEHAIALIERDRPDAAFLDLDLPDLDGCALAEQIRRSDPDRSIRLFALTGYGTEVHRTRTLEAGFRAHLIKPARLGDLLAVLNAP